MRRIAIRGLTLVMFLFTASCAGNLPKHGTNTDPDLFRSEGARIEMKKPSGWHFTIRDTAFAKVDFEDKKFRQELMVEGRSPIVAAAKHPEPYDRPNPVIRVTLRPALPLEGTNEVEILGVLARQVADDRKGSIVEPSHAVTVGGKKAASATTRYSLRVPDGREFPILTTMVVVPRKSVFYVFEFSGSPDGEDAVSAIIEPVLATVKFLD